MSRPHARASSVAWITVCGLGLLAMDAQADWPTDPQVNLALETASLHQLSAVSVADGTGGAIVVWRDFRNGADFDVFAQKVTAGGTLLWGPNGIAVCQAVNDQLAPVLVSDDAGGAIITWEDSRVVGQDVYAQRVDASGQTLWATDGVLLAGATGSQLLPRIVSDTQGGAIVAWTDFRAGALGADVYVQRVDGSGTPLWASNGVALSLAPASQFEPRLAPDGSGGAIVAWQDLRTVTTTGYNIYAQRVDGSGSVLWTADGVAVCVTRTDPGVLSIVADGSSGAVIAWQDARNFVSTGSDVYAQRLDPSGAPLWDVNGIAVCTAIDQQHHPELVADGTGGAIVVWDDARGSLRDGDIYVQRIDATGTPLWTANGVGICTFAWRQLYPVPVSDASGGAIVAWHDFRVSSGYSDIRAARVDPQGTALWTANGIVVSNAASYQLRPTLVASDAGGAIVAWQDARSADYDIYAQRIQADGTLGGEVTDATVDTGRPTGFWLESATPNPVVRTSKVRFGLPRRAFVRLAVYDVAGRLVRALASGEHEAGVHVVEWDGRGPGGTEIASGAYFVRLEAAGRVLTKSLVTIR